MSLSNVALGLRAGGAWGLEDSRVSGFPAAAPVAPAALADHAGPTGGSARDSAIASLPGISAAVNLLGQAAGAQTSGSSEDPLVGMPPLPPMPAPKAAAAVPTDDHGQSNIVFSDQDDDGSFIH